MVNFWKSYILPKNFLINFIIMNCSPSMFIALQEINNALIFVYIALRNTRWVLSMRTIIKSTIDGQPTISQPVSIAALIISLYIDDLIQSSLSKKVRYPLTRHLNAYIRTNPWSFTILMANLDSQISICPFITYFAAVVRATIIY